MNKQGRYNIILNSSSYSRQFLRESVEYLPLSNSATQLCLYNQSPALSNVKVVISNYCNIIEIRGKKFINIKTAKFGTYIHHQINSPSNPHFLLFIAKLSNFDFVLVAGI